MSKEGIKNAHTTLLEINWNNINDLCYKTGFEFLNPILWIEQVIKYALYNCQIAKLIFANQITCLLMHF